MGCLHGFLNSASRRAQISKPLGEWLKGVILLNPHLVKAPRECIDYVILHELCHLKEHNHSPRFYRLLSQLKPRWRPVKAKLDGLAELLLNE